MSADQPNDRGRLIVIEGPDGAGKTTLHRALAAALDRQGEDVLALREPGGTPLSERIRSLLKGEVDEVTEIDPRAETLLFCAARAQLAAEVIRPALARGQWVLLDRYVGSTVIYQGQLRELGEKAVLELSAFATAELADPDLTLIVDITPQEALARMRERDGEVADRIERELALRHGQLIDAYAALPGVHINGGAAPERVLASALEAIEHLLP